MEKKLLIPVNLKQTGHQSVFLAEGSLLYAVNNIKLQKCTAEEREGSSTLLQAFYIHSNHSAIMNRV